MFKVLIKEDEKQRKIALVENDKLIEYYEENDTIVRNEGNIYIGIVKDIINGMQSAFVNIGTEKNSFIHLSDLLPKVDETKTKKNSNTNISKVIKQNQKILVQVKRDSNEKKGARVSTHINLPSKYIALMPNTDIVTVSRKIEDKIEQERLTKLVKENLSKGNGAIIRTSATGKTEEIIEDIKYIESKWNNIIKTKINPNSAKPQLLYKSEGIVEKILIDIPNAEIEKIIVNNENIKKDLKNIKIPIEINEKEEIFDIDLEKQIKKIQNRKIWLKCGGFITIDKTEALTAIDVNTGKFTGRNNLEQTVFKVNSEATIEVAKQLRLRDIGGIIIIDYIDMKNDENKKKIEEVLKQEVKKDRSKTQVEGFTKLDLMELTRKHICSHDE